MSVVHVQSPDNNRKALCGKDIPLFKAAYLDADHLLLTVKACDGIRGPGWNEWCLQCLKIANQE